MAESPSQLAELAVTDPALPDGLRVRRWFAVYSLFLLACAAPMAALIASAPATWQDWTGDFPATFSQQPAATKLLALGVYLSLACTFLPLPTAWIVGAVALPEMAVGSNIWTTALIVAAVGAAGSTVANLHDYHLFTLLLRTRRVANIRNTRLYQASAGWSAKSPFSLLVIFNIVPIPVDVIRMLATSYRYPRLPFAAANFIGRFIRYAVIAACIYLLGERGRIGVLALLGVAFLIGAERIITTLIRRRRRKNQENLT